MSGVRNKSMTFFECPEYRGGFTLEVQIRGSSLCNIKC